MAENFTNFVLKLAQDPQTLAQFQKQPDPTMKAADLSPAEQSILLSGNAAVIREALVADVGGKDLAGSIWPITVVVAVSIAVFVHAADTEVKSPE